MVNLTILAGGYTTFVATYLFNTDTKALSLAGQSTTGANPSWIALHPTNSSVLYAVNENDPGSLQSFTIEKDFLLSPAVSTVGSGGDGPAFTTPLSTGQVAIMDYNSGTGQITPTTSDPLQFESAQPITFPAPVSHPHMALENGDEVLVPDLGADKIWRLNQVAPNTPGEWEIHGFIQQPNGSGPRHIALKDGFLFTLHELASTLTSQRLPPAPNGTTPLISNVSIIPPNPPAGGAFAAAEILYPTPSAQFTGDFIYVSNRNTGTQDSGGDAITIFKTTKEGELSIVDYVFTGLDQIRGMQLFGENDEFLIAGGFAAGGVAVFGRTGNGNGLELIARNTDLPTRTSFVWVH